MDELKGIDITNPKIMGLQIFAQIIKNVFRKMQFFPIAKILKILAKSWSYFAQKLTFT